MQHAAAAPRILVTESRDRVGGNVTTDSNDKEGLLWEEGPNSFQPNDFILQAAVRASRRRFVTHCMRWSPGGAGRRREGSLAGCCCQPQHAHVVTCCDGARAVQRGLGSLCSVARCTCSCCCVQVDAGVADELVLGDPKAPRFVYWDKELRPTPSGPDVLTFNLMSPLGKIRAGLGAMGFKAPLPGGRRRLSAGQPMVEQGAAGNARVSSSRVLSQAAGVAWLLYPPVHAPRHSLMCPPPLPPPPPPPLPLVIH